jgi:hypothetical protein
MSFSISCDHGHGSNIPYHTLNRVPNGIPAEEPVARGVVRAGILQGLRVIDFDAAQEVLWLIGISNVATYTKACFDAVLILPDKVREFIGTPTAVTDT